MPTTGSGGEDDGHRCSCSISVLPSPAGEIMLVGVDGEIDLATLAMVAAALDRSLSSSASHIVVNLSGLAFCDARGALLLLDAAARAAQQGIGYSVSGVPAQLERLWSMLVPAGRRPVHFPTTERALVDVLTRTPRRSTTRATDRRDRAAADAGIPDGPDRGPVSVARAGDPAAYRELVHRNRLRVYRSALHSLSACDDPDAATRDIVARLRDVLAGLVSADPG